MGPRGWPPAQPDEEPGSVARPYTITRGRTRPRGHQEIELETLVWTNSEAERSMAVLSAHWRAVAALCLQVSSLAEVAAHLGVPIGVARVLIADMAEAGLVALQEYFETGFRAVQLDREVDRSWRAAWSEFKARLQTRAPR